MPTVVLKLLAGQGTGRTDRLYYKILECEFLPKTLAKVYTEKPVILGMKAKGI